MECTTSCKCQSAGYCKTHDMNMTEEMVRLCQSRQDYYDLWASGVAKELQKVRAAILACNHKGPQISTIGCGSCGDTVEIPVYECKLFSECTESPTQEAIKCCSNCKFKTQGDGQMTEVTLQSGQSPGDIVVLSAAIKALHDNYPGRFLTHTETPCQGIFEGNHYTVPGTGGEKISIGYSADSYSSIHRCNQHPRHFVEAYCADIAKKLDVPEFGPKDWNEPSILLNGSERNWFPQVAGDYWIVNSGIKHDFTAKRWNGYQEVIDRTKDKIQWVQIGSTEHDHQPLSGVIDLLGKTDLRQLIRLVYHAKGVLCGVTALMHLSHWVERKGNQSRHACVIAGGREPPHWFAYPGHQVFHTIGELDCCLSGGCWKSRVTKLDMHPEHNGSLCLHPEGNVGACMSRISSDLVSSVIERMVSVWRF